MSFLINFIIAALATVSFAILFHAPKTELAICGFTGGLSWLVYDMVTAASVSKILASFIATFILMFFARSFAVARQMPVTVYLMSGIFPLVPGAGIYFTAYYMFTQQRMLFSRIGMETFQIALAIVLGIVFGFAVPQQIFHHLFVRATNSGPKDNKPSDGQPPAA